MITKLPNGKYQVHSKSTGKALSKPVSKKAAVKRLKQVEYFKSQPKKK